MARRFGALLVDWLLCVLAAGLFADPRRDGWAPPLVLIGEYTFFLGFFVRTPGMWVARIRCIAVGGGGPVGPFRAALRGALLCLLVPALIMKDGRGLHDRAAGSVVVDGR
ncbi:MAG: transporter [Actinobacteria bacterium 13_2_20CM_2_71_6]|nr:MAG: transporter [Actinobacteria bacterium 13_2_20CM_2_71_6]